MIPLELEIDKQGLLYMKDDNILSKRMLDIDKRANLENRYFQNYFYPIPSTDEYVIKYSSTFFTRKEIKRIKEMLINLISKQKYVYDVDFPIGYFMQFKKLSGLIIKYYKDGISCDNILKNHDIENLGKYYYHDEDNIRNLFGLFIETINIVEELFDNGVYYTDLNPGNVLIDNNKVKLIDFDYRFVLFDRKDERLRTIMYSIFYFLRETLWAYGIYNSISEDFNNFYEAKKYVKKLENVVRKG